MWNFKKCGYVHFKKFEYHEKFFFFVIYFRKWKSYIT